MHNLTPTQTVFASAQAHTRGVLHEEACSHSPHKRRRGQLHRTRITETQRRRGEGGGSRQEEEGEEGMRGHEKMRLQEEHCAQKRRGKRFLMSPLFVFKVLKEGSVNQANRSIATEDH